MRYNEAKPKTISVEERLPDHNGAVLALVNEGEEFGFYSPIVANVILSIGKGGKKFTWIGKNGLGGTLTGVTHWMPLPEPPEEEGQ